MAKLQVDSSGVANSYPASGQAYNVNTATNEWWREPPSVENKSSEWVKKKDPTSGAAYYVNTVTKESRWLPPEDAQPSEITVDSFEDAFAAVGGRDARP